MADFAQIIQQLQQQVNTANGRARQAVEAMQAQSGQMAVLSQQLLQQNANMQVLSDALSRLQVGQAGSGAPEHTRYVDQIQGTRVPFDVVVQIPIGPNVTTSQENTYPISMDGPFIAVRRYAAFLSQAVAAYTDPSTGTRSAVFGRSFGRWRPVHSMWDLNDSMAGSFQPTAGGPLPGTGTPIYASPSSQSGFRTMEFDGLIEFINAGSSYPRQNQPIPSAFYSEQINSPFDLPALDFFAQSEVLKWRVTPTHPNNPPYGNASGFGATSVFPFLDSQFDVQEGFVDKERAQTTTDPLVRLANGTLFIGLSGYKIIQIPGVVRPV
jgi:hypothetical protein